METWIEHSLYFGLFLTIAAYVIGLKLKKKFKISLLNAPFVSVVIVIAVLLIGDIDYNTYNRSADLLTRLITPATICLAIPLYRQMQQLRAHFMTILISVLCGMLGSALTILGLCTLFHFNHDLYVTMLPKTVTTAVGMEISRMMGGHMTITVAAICITGLLGNTFGESACRLMRIKDPIAQGLCIGACSHASGTARALQMGEVQGAMSSIAMVTAAIMTVILSSLFENFI